MCFDLFQPTIKPPTAQSEKYVQYLKILLWTTVSFAVIKLFLGMIAGNFGAFTDFICALILYMAYSQINYSGLIFYEIIVGFHMITTLALFGKAFQNKINIFGGSSTIKNLKLFMIFISLLYQLTGIVLVFYSYREFKYISNFMPESLYHQQNENEEQSNYYRREPQSRYAEAHPYGNDNDNENQRHQEQRPVYSVQLGSNQGNFSGQGVQIG